MTIAEEKSTCSFCGRNEGRIFSGRTGHICLNCTKVCYNLLSTSSITETHDFSEVLNPMNIKKKLDECIIGQHQAKKILSVAVYNHFKRVRHNASNPEVTIQKNNVILIGPTGSGKTFLAETLAKMFKIPFAVADATTLTEAGYVGGEPEDILIPLLKSCELNVESAENGIIYIDEVDKIARTVGAGHRDVSGQGVQRGLLKILEGTKAKVKVSKNQEIEIDTTNILFILGGAFDGLDSILEAGKDSKTGIGFGAELKNTGDIDKDHQRSKVTPEDLIKYGFMPEFIGRISILAVLNTLTVQDLTDILDKPKNSLVKQYEALFSGDNVGISFTSASLEAIAKEAITRKTGARGLKAILEKVLLEAMYESPSNDITHVEITEDLVKEKCGGAK